MSDVDIAQDRIRKACREVTAVRPAYTEILKFYEAVFLAQEEAKAHTHVPQIDIPEDILAMKLAEKFPLVAAADFELAKENLTDFCPILTNAIDKLQVVQSF